MISDEDLIQLDSISVGKRNITPIVRLALYLFDETYFLMDYEVVSFKISEYDNVYYKNIKLSDDEFDNLKKGKFSL